MVAITKRKRAFVDVLFDVRLVHSILFCIEIISRVGRIRLRKIAIFRFMPRHARAISREKKIKTERQQRAKRKIDNCIYAIERARKSITTVDDDDDDDDEINGKWLMEMQITVTPVRARNVSRKWIIYLYEI